MGDPRGECNGHESLPVAVDDDIAIVGMAMRLPGGVHNAEDFWELLTEKRSGISPVPQNRFNVHAFHSFVPKAGTMQTSHGYFLNDVEMDKFDASHFSFSRKEVERMDPCQRQLLEIAWECLENAGETEWQGKDVGCYVGAFGEDWLQDSVLDTHHSGIYRVSGMSDFMLSNRVSYAFNFHGPSTTIKTGCSSTLVALNHAAEALRKGECCSAVVLGCNLMLSPLMTVAYTAQGILSPSGRSRTFDASADGYGRGEAVNGLFVKKLSDALRDGNPIRAILRSSATQHDGKKSGLLNPNSYAQEALIRHTYKIAGISDYSKTAFIECHGTGTAVGDPAEVGAVARVFGDSGIIIGGVKPNVGHSEGAAGLTSAIKAILALEHRQIPPNIYFERPNPRIPWKSAHLSVPTETLPWPADRLERVSVNSFGVGGTNAHIILESYESQSKISPPHASGEYLLLFSASSLQSLEDHVEKYAEYMYNKRPNLTDLAYTLGCRRQRLACRTYAILNNPQHFEPVPFRGPSAKPDRTVFAFTGQGAQWPEMGRDLMESNLVFRRSIQSLDKYLSRIPHPPSWTIEDELCKSSGGSRLMTAEYSLPCCTAVQIALVDVLRSWGITPHAVLGHSSGEIAGAYAAGALSAGAAIIVAYFRGYIFCTADNLRPGAMAAIGLSAKELTSFLLPGVVVGCENSQRSTTISGDKDCVEQVVEEIKSKCPGVLARLLQVDTAYHSPHMKPYGAAYEAILKDYVRSSSPVVPYFSSVTGKEVTTNELGPRYWHLSFVQPVLFNTAMRSALEVNKTDSTTVFVEIGAHPALKGPMQQIWKDFPRLTNHHISTLRRDESPKISLLKTAGELYLENVDLDWSQLTPEGQVLTNLPTYSWLHEVSYWDEPRAAKAFKHRKFLRHDLLGSRIVEGCDIEPTWRNVVNMNDISWIADHVITDQIVFPAAGYISMAEEALRQYTEDDVDTYVLRKLSITAALTLRLDKIVELHTRLRPLPMKLDDLQRWHEIQIVSWDSDVWTKHCSAYIARGDVTNLEATIVIPPQLHRLVDRDYWYDTAKKMGLGYGPAFQGLDEISASPNVPRAVASISNYDDSTNYAIHPATVDQCFQIAIVAGCQGLARKFTQLSIPTSIEQVTVHRASDEMIVEGNAILSPSGSLSADISVYSKTGRLVLSMEGFQASPLSVKATISNERLVSYLHWDRDASLLPMNENPPWKACAMDPPVLLDQLILLNSLQFLEKSTDSISHLTEKCSLWSQRNIENAKKGCFGLLHNPTEILQLASTPRRKLMDDVRSLICDTDVASLSAAIELLFTDGENTALEVITSKVIEQRNASVRHKDLLCRTVKLLAHKKPMLRILELGTGSEVAVRIILDALRSPYGEQLYRSYTYASMTWEAMDETESTLSDLKGVELLYFDLEMDAEEQGLRTGSYDLIISTDYLNHALRLDDTLARLKGLLSQDGMLLLLELLPRPQWLSYFDTTFFDDGEEASSLDQTQEIYPHLPSKLLECGFEPPFESDKRTAQSRIWDIPVVAKVIREPKISDQVAIVASNNSHHLADRVQTIFHENGIKTTMYSLGAQIPEGQDIISLIDMGEDYVYELTATRFRELITFLGRPNRSVIWLTPVAQISSKNPNSAMIIGLARTLRSELNANIITVEVDPCELTKPRTIEAVLQIYERSKHTSAVLEVSPDQEYAIIHDVVQVPRLFSSPVQEELVKSASKLGCETTAVLELGSSRRLDTQRWVTRPISPLEDGQIKVEVMAAGLSRKDLVMSKNMKMGKFSTLGREGAGVVREVGSAVDNFRPGDRVVFLCQGSVMSHKVLPTTSCIRIDDSLSFEESSILPYTYGTAYMALVEQGRIQREDTLLITSAFSDLGLAMIHIAIEIGAVPYAVVDYEEQRAILSTDHKIPSDRIFIMDQPSAADGIKGATGGDGVDCIVVPHYDARVKSLYKSLSDFGLLLHCDNSALESGDSFAATHSVAQRQYQHIDIQQLCMKRPQKFARIMHRCIELLHGHCRNNERPLQCFDASHSAEAFLALEDSSHTDRVVIRPPPSCLYNKSVLEDCAGISPQFSSSVCYLMVGGLGGIGRAVSNWMVENGARNLLFLSRSAQEGPRTSPFFDELRAQGCNVQAYRGSVCNLYDVTNAVKSSSKPIGGVMQMSMVLRDNAISRMTFEEWQECVKPKVEGTWNLHRALQNADLDFFVLFSSISGTVGQVGQANYNAANTFMDAFVRYRHGLDLPASVIDIGVMGEIGAVAESQALQEQFSAGGYYFLTEQDLLNGLTIAISNSQPTAAASETSQVVLGLCATKPLADPTLRVIWKRDPRMAVARNVGTSESRIEESSNSGVKEILSYAATKPEKLQDEETIKLIAEVTGKALFGLLVKPLEGLILTVSLENLGLDSLVAIELNHWIEQNFHIVFTVLELLRSSSLNSLARQISALLCK